MTTDESEGAFVAWGDYRSDDPGYYAQHVSSDGTILWGPAGTPVATGARASTSTWPRIASCGGGKSFVTWNDLRRFPDSDIYAKRMTDEALFSPATLSLVDAKTSPESTGSAVVSMQHVDGLSLRFRLATGEYLSAFVYDIMGRKVRNLSVANPRLGDQVLAWDGREDSGMRARPGVYFVRVFTGQRAFSADTVLLR